MPAEPVPGGRSGGPGGSGEGADDRALPRDLPGRVVLVGGMAAGKSSAGRRLARRIGYRFVDLDEEVERRAGRSIPEIFREEGEEGFRRREADVTRALDPASEGDELVVAAGGGWMAREELRDRWPGAERVWLKVSPEEALRRLEGDVESRPMLDPERPLQTLRRVLERRRRHYARAEHAVDTGGRTPEEVADRVLEALLGS